MGGRDMTDYIARKFFRQPETIEEPLNRSLGDFDGRILALESSARIDVTQPLDVIIASNTPGNAPWPLRIGQQRGQPAGVIVLRADNLTTAGTAGVSTTAIAAPQWYCENGAVLVHFVSGLTLSAQYRLVFGVLYV